MVGLALVLYGAGNGIYSIARGTVPLALFGPERYAALVGRLARPGLVAQALAPSVGAVVLTHAGADTTYVLLCVLAVANVALALSLWRVRSRGLKGRRPPPTFAASDPDQTDRLPSGDEAVSSASVDWLGGSCPRPIPSLLTLKRFHNGLSDVDEKQALDGFGAIAQETRLRIVRLLVTAGADGMAAGAITEAIAGASAPRISFHLSHLENAGLVVSRREGRSIIYSAVFTGPVRPGGLPDARLLRGTLRGLRPSHRPVRPVHRSAPAGRSAIQDRL